MEHCTHQVIDSLIVLVFYHSYSHKFFLPGSTQHLSVCFSVFHWQFLHASRFISSMTDSASAEAGIHRADPHYTHVVLGVVFYRTGWFCYSCPTGLACKISTSSGVTSQLQAEHLSWNTFINEMVLSQTLGCRKPNADCWDAKLAPLSAGCKCQLATCQRVPFRTFFLLFWVLQESTARLKLHKITFKSGFGKRLPLRRPYQETPSSDYFLLTNLHQRSAVL